MQMDQVDLRDAALVPTKNPSLGKIGPKVSSLQEPSGKASSPIIQHEVDVAFLDQFVGYQRNASVVVGSEDVAATIKRLPAFDHLQGSHQEGAVVPNYLLA